MRNLKLWVPATMLVALIGWGCQQAPDETASTPAPQVDGDHADHDHDGDGHPDHDDHGHDSDGATVTLATVSLCGSCGQVKGSGVCCKADAKICGKCSLADGAPGCCIMKPGDKVALCATCGHIAGADACCKEGAEKCAECQLVKGSPGCCKIKVAGADVAAAGDET